MKFRLFVVLLAFLASCKSEVYDATPETGSPVCDTIDYTTQIKPLFDTHCNSCHFDGGTAPGNFTELSVIQNQKDRIKVRAVIEGTMPPGGPMSDAERELLGAWIDCGAIGQEGDQDVSYATDIDPIMKTYCTACHTNNGTAPGDFNVYADVKNAVDNKNLEVRVFDTQDMPPAPQTMQDQDKRKLKKWLDAGAPNN